MQATFTDEKTYEVFFHVNFDKISEGAIQCDMMKMPSYGDNLLKIYLLAIQKQKTQYNMETLKDIIEKRKDDIVTQYLRTMKYDIDLDIFNLIIKSSVNLSYKFAPESNMSLLTYFFSSEI